MRVRGLPRGDSLLSRGSKQKSGKVLYLSTWGTTSHKVGLWNFWFLWTLLLNFHLLDDFAHSGCGSTFSAFWRRVRGVKTHCSFIKVTWELKERRHCAGRTRTAAAPWFCSSSRFYHFLSISLGPILNWTCTHSIDRMKNCASDPIKIPDLNCGARMSTFAHFPLWMTLEVEYVSVKPHCPSIVSIKQGKKWSMG